MHFINRKSLSIFARLMLAVMLFAQFSLAAQACVLPDASPAMAFSADPMPGCHMGNMSATYNPNACLVHCTNDNQTLDSHHIAFDIPVVFLPSAWRIEQEPMQASLPQRPLLLTRLVDPPTYLLYQNFRN